MAISTTLARLLPLLLLLLPPALREPFSGSHHRPPKDAVIGAQELHPVVLVPGLGCSDLEARLAEEYRPSAPRCGAMKGKGWFELWKNASDLVDHDYVQCFLEQIRLVYDPAIDDYRNLPGVETRVPNFGSPSGFHDKNPLHPKRCLDKVREALERLGYRDGDTLFGAPYDWRHAPPAPGQASQVYSLYFQQLRDLIEAASKNHSGRKAIIFAHSFGGMVALEFVRNAPLPWRSRYIKHLILVAPTLSAGFLQQALALTSGAAQMIYVPATAAADASRALWRSFETAVADLPSPMAFGREPIVVTKRRNYSAHDMEDFLAAVVGVRDGVEPFRRRMVPKMRCFRQAPMVPVTCINGVGNRTPRRLVFWEGDFDAPPEIVYGDGDGFVNLASMLAFDRAMRGQPAQKTQFKSVKIDKAEHSGLVTDEWALNLVMQEFLEANR